MFSLFSKRSKLLSNLPTSRQSEPETIRLFSSFYENLDMEKWRSLAERIVKDSQSYNRFKLGGGYHFDTYKDPANDGSFRYCLKIATDRFMEEKKERHSTEWQSSIKKLVSMRAPMIPPMEFINGINYLAIVMPEFSLVHGLTSKSADFSAKVLLLEKDLAANGLRFRDGYQIGTWSDSPFIYDFSDLSISK